MCNIVFLGSCYGFIVWYWYMLQFNTAVIHVYSLFRVRLITLAAQKFISDIINDSLQHCKLRGSSQATRKGSKVHTTLYSHL